MGTDPRLYRRFLMDALTEGRMSVLAARYGVSPATMYRMRKQAIGDGALVPLGECKLAQGPNQEAIISAHLPSAVRRRRRRESKRHHKTERRYRRRLRMAALIHYGDKPPRCVCCGESHLEFLCIDHIDGGGNRHRESIKRTAGTSFYAWLKRNDYPLGYRVLCHNCNLAIGFYGACPHAPQKDS